MSNDKIQNLLNILSPLYHAELLHIAILIRRMKTAEQQDSLIQTLLNASPWTSDICRAALVPFLSAGQDRTVGSDLTDVRLLAFSLMRFDLESLLSKGFDDER
jgi:hypothetical protein